jgi:hypothetical protein
MWRMRLCRKVFRDGTVNLAAALASTCSESRKQTVDEVVNHRVRETRREVNFGIFRSLAVWEATGPRSAYVLQQDILEVAAACAEMQAEEAPTKRIDDARNSDVFLNERIFEAVHWQLGGRFR